MNEWLFSVCLLAQNTRAEQFVKGFREGNGNVPFNVLLTIAVAALAVTAAMFIVQRFVSTRREGCIFVSDRALFLDLCRIHHLDLLSIRFLEQVVKANKLNHAAEVFVRPDLFRSELLTALEHPALAHRVREKLFGAGQGLGS